MEQDFHQNFLDRSTLHGLHDCAHFFNFIYGLKDLTNALCKVVCDYTTVQVRWFHMGGYVQFMYEWVKCSSHKTSLCICCGSILSLVQIFFSFVSNSSSFYYHTLPYPKTKEKKI